MSVPEIVIDTCVLIAAPAVAIRGASHQLLLRIGTGLFNLHLSVPLLLQYEQVAKRQIAQLGITPGTIDDVLDYLCSVAQQHEIYYLWLYRSSPIPTTTWSWKSRLPANAATS